MAIYGEEEPSKEREKFLNTMEKIGVVTIRAYFESALRPSIVEVRWRDHILVQLYLYAISSGGRGRSKSNLRRSD
jgi:hypothetical protein